MRPAIVLRLLLCASASLIVLPAAPAQDDPRCSECVDRFPSDETGLYIEYHTSTSGQPTFMERCALDHGTTSDRICYGSGATSSYAECGDIALRDWAAPNGGWLDGGDGRLIRGVFFGQLWVESSGVDIEGGSLAVHVLLAGEIEHDVTPIQPNPILVLAASSSHLDFWLRVDYGDRLVSPDFDYTENFYLQTRGDLDGLVTTQHHFVNGQPDTGWPLIGDRVLKVPLTRAVARQGIVDVEMGVSLENRVSWETLSSGEELTATSLSSFRVTVLDVQLLDSSDQPVPAFRFFSRSGFWETFQPPATGACVLPGGSCDELTGGECDAAGGVYQGDYSPCSEVAGSCSMPDGSCDRRTEGECIANGGTYAGAGTSCGRSAAGVVDPEGGIVQTPDGSVTVDVSPGAVAEAVEITVDQGPEWIDVVTDQGLARAVYQVILGPEGVTFGSNVAITFQWPDQDSDGLVDDVGVDESALLVVKDGVVITPPCSDELGCSQDTNRLSVEVDSFSEFALAVLTESPQRTFLRSDCNVDGEVDISDAIATLGVLFLGNGTFHCMDACDSNDDGDVDISDAVASLAVLFLGQGQIPFPGTEVCGADPSMDSIDCESYEACP